MPQDGFSLVEVLVAFTITALVLGMVYQIFARGAGALVIGAEYAGAVILAESRLAVAAADIERGLAPQPSGLEQAMQWQLTVTPFTTADDTGTPDPLPLVRVDVRVDWQGMGGRRSFSLATLRPGPRS